VICTYRHEPDDDKTARPTPFELLATLNVFGSVEAPVVYVYAGSKSRNEAGVIAANDCDCA